MAFYISRSWVRKRLARSPFAEEATSLYQVLREKGLKGVSEEISDEMTETLGITGTPEVLNERLKEYEQAGLDTVTQVQQHGETPRAGEPAVDVIPQH